MRLLSSRPTYSWAFLRPFFQELETLPEFAASVVDSDSPPITRITVQTAHALLKHAAEVTGNDDLGLRAARRMRLGELGALDYVMQSSATIREAFSCATRFGQLTSDIVEITVSTVGDQCIVRFANTMNAPRAVVDLLIGWFFRMHLRSWLAQDDQQVTVLFPYAKPVTTSEHERTFESAHHRFAAPCAGFALDASCLDRKLQHGNRELHAILDEYAQTKLETLVRVQTLTSMIRKQLIEDFPNQNLSLDHIARSHQLTPRTMNRHLEREGTSYSQIVDDVRRELAVKNVEEQRIPLPVLAEHLQFTHLASFHRAFKRWTGMTPLRFRRMRRP